MTTAHTVALGFALVACGGSSPADLTNNAPAGPSSTPTFVTDTPGTSVTDSCSEAAKLVYVVSQEKDLYSFAPDKLVFAKIGRLDCPAPGIPDSMAIDRTGTAWVNYANGALFRVSTVDAECSTTLFAPNQQGFSKFGMAFSANASGAGETLFISGLSGTSGAGFGKVDLTTMQISMLGDYSGDLAKRPAELTGTGDGRLFGFFTTSPSATLATIDQPSGATSADTALAGVATGNAFAFSFWGGDFWFYTSDGLSPSRVTHRKSSGDLDVALADVGGFRIVGAGVSTCAPTRPVN